MIGGSIVYRLLIAISLRLGIAPTDLKLLTAVLVVVALSVPTVRKKVTIHTLAFGSFEESKEARVIAEARPDIVWCGLGAPRQEIWMRRWAWCG